MTSQAPKPPLVFYRTGPMPCPYLEGRVERNLFTELRGAQARDLHDQLAQAGFRRSHHIVYRPACPGCDGCVPIRVDVRNFAPSRSQRRLLRINGDLTVRAETPVATDEHYELFVRYQQSRHAGGEMAAMSFGDFRAMIEDTVIDTELVTIRDKDGRLFGGCLTDRLSNGLSAVYSYFEPAEARRSLGTFCVLWLVGHAGTLGLPFVYLGYWIEGCGKMSYKTRFRPVEALGPSGWQPLDVPDS